MGSHDQRTAAQALERAFALQPPHGLADGGAGNTEAAGDLTLGDHLAGDDGAAQDHVEQRSVGHDRELLAIARFEIFSDQSIHSATGIPSVYQKFLANPLTMVYQVYS